MSSVPRAIVRGSLVGFVLILAAPGLRPADPQNASRGNQVSANKVQMLDHLVINVTDMERALAFYKRLGFELNNEEGWRRGQGQVSIQIGENQKINLHQEEKLGPQLKPAAVGAADEYRRALVPVAGGTDFCVVWGGTVEEAERYLKEKSVQTFTRQVTAARGPSTSVYFRDPDGNLWEFTVYPR